MADKRSNDIKDQDININEDDFDDTDTYKEDTQKINEEEKKDIKKDKKEKSESDSVIEKLKKYNNDELIKMYVKAIKDHEKTKKVLIEKEKETQDMLDKYRRALAEMENIRKRTLIEKQDSLKYANFNIISDLLVILDDFERAITSAKSNENATDLSHFVEGIDMIEKQFADLLFKKYGVTKYCEVNDEFDPKIHLAMTLEEGEFKEETVVEVYRKGYMLHDRVIRAAEVKVGKPKEN
jgi:molecular chaperone GrpE